MALVALTLLLRGWTFARGFGLLVRASGGRDVPAVSYCEGAIIPPVPHKVCQDLFCGSAAKCISNGLGDLEN